MKNNPQSPKIKSEFHSEFGAFITGLSSAASLHVRRKMYHEFHHIFGHPQSVLDVGVTSENVAAEANYFEEMFPYKDRITAVGVEDAFHLEIMYPGLKFILIHPEQALPFENKHFDLVFSNAVIEHIVDDQDRLFFLRELHRVGHSVFLTTPNRYFPIEHHTGIPLIHFLAPRLFFKLLDRKKSSKFYNSRNLRPFSRTELENLARKIGCHYEVRPVWFLGFVSNWILILWSDKKP